MQDYKPLDLTTQVNAYDDLVIPGAELRLGSIYLRGLPFLFAADGDRTRVVHLESGQRTLITIETPDPCRTVTFAHRVSSDGGPSLIAVGQEDAVYSFRYSNGQTSLAVIREGYEIAAPWHGDDDHWGLRPSLALPDQRDGLPSRTEGAFADIGQRQTEVVEAANWSRGVSDSGQVQQGWRFYLWSWINPHPDRRLVEIELLGGAVAVDVGGVCLGFLAEHPLRPDPARVVVADIPPAYLATPTDLAIEVDRGSAGYTTALQDQSGNDPLSTWGDAPDSVFNRVYARVSAIPSATVRLMANGKALDQARWRDLRTATSLREARLRLTEGGRNWVRTRFLDDATGEPIACRVHFSSLEGIPYQPHGHPQHINSNLGSWHSDIGGDVRLGRTSFAYLSGSCEGWLPRGGVRIRVARGFDYEPFDAIVPVDEDTQDLTLRLRRLYDPIKEGGWYSGDTHVHFLSSIGGLLEAAAEGLSVVNLLQSQWGSLFTSTEEFLGSPLATPDGSVILYTSQENRQHFLGHLSLLGLKEPVMPWCSDGPQEAEMGGGLETTLSDWADRCHAQGGTTVVPHFPQPNGELATLIATGRADALEVTFFPENAYSEYYTYLNAGFSVPLAGGTDKMTSDVPVGLRRTYVQLNVAEDFTYASWCDSLRAGRTFVSSGPLLELTVDGVGIGGEVQLPERGGAVTVSARARSIFPIFNLELVRDGKVVAATHSTVGSHALHLVEELRFGGAGWICARVGGGPGHLTHHRDISNRDISAHSSPIYVKCGDQHRRADRVAMRYIMELVDRGQAYVRGLAPLDTGSDTGHLHHADHREDLERPFEEARVALMRRLET
jgi:hypothetical protein